jgi:hypothetical protein
MIQLIRRSRMFGWDRNPLRRRTDRLEAVMVAGLIAVFVVTAPVLAAAAGHWTSRTCMREQRAQASWRRVSAIIQRVAPSEQSLVSTTYGWKPARWTAPDGQKRTASIPVSPGTAPGSRTRVWVDRSGALTGSPLRRSQVQGWIVSAKVSATAGLALIVWYAGRAGRLQFGRRRLSHWEREWQAVEAHWTRQRLSLGSYTRNWRDAPAPIDCPATRSPGLLVRYADSNHPDRVTVSGPRMGRDRTPDAIVMQSLGVPRVAPGRRIDAGGPGQVAVRVHIY